MLSSVFIRKAFPSPSCSWVFALLNLPTELITSSSVLHGTKMPAWKAIMLSDESALKKLKNEVFSTSFLVCATILNTKRVLASHNRFPSSLPLGLEHKNPSNSSQRKTHCSPHSYQRTFVTSLFLDVVLIPVVFHLYWGRKPNTYTYFTHIISTSPSRVSLHQL